MEKTFVVNRIAITVFVHVVYNWDNTVKSKKIMSLNFMPHCYWGAETEDTYEQFIVNNDVVTSREFDKAIQKYFDMRSLKFLLNYLNARV